MTYEGQIEYNIFLAEEAHKRGLAIALKNDVEQVEELVEYFDFAVNEECFLYDECENLIPFIQNEKAVFHVEYEVSKSKFCSYVKNLGFQSLKMNLDLDGSRDSC